MQCRFVIRKPDFYYLLFEKALLQTTGKIPLFLASGAEVCFAFDKFGFSYLAACLILFYTPQLHSDHFFLPHAPNSYLNEINKKRTANESFFACG